MTIEARIIEDSVTEQGKRLTTFVLKYPRFIHSEVLTHRMLSRNASSSRAIPVEKIIQQVLDDPAMPVYWGKNQKGMQADQELSEEQRSAAERIWLLARDEAVLHARLLVELGVHKQIANRILEPFHHIQVVVSATEWENFFTLRRHKDAQPEFNQLATVMAVQYRLSQPKLLRTGEWHLPFIREDERKQYLDEQLIKCSVARCARVSYMNHDGSAPDIQKDFELHDKLVVSRPLHASPAEHQATPAYSSSERSGNFVGWYQYRKDLQNENAKTFPWEEQEDHELNQLIQETIENV